jgi:uncharacterized protein YraI
MLRSVVQALALISLSLTAAAAETNYNVTGQSLGGKVRAGPGLNYRQIDSLSEGQDIRIVTGTGVMMNGYEWFEIGMGENLGYQWGGILCSNGEKLPGIFSACAPQRAENAAVAGGGSALKLRARSVLGGKVRSGPATNTRVVGGVVPGGVVTIVGRSGVIIEGDFEWFEITFGKGKHGYMAGFLLCPDGGPIPGTQCID